MLVTLFRLLSTLPLSFLHAIGSACGWLVYLVSASYRNKLKDNLFRAGYPNHLSQAISESGKSMFELPFIWCASPQRVLRTATIENWELAQAALDAKTGVIFLTPHLGCFEIIAQAIAAKTSLTALYRPPRKDALKPLIEGARGRHNLLLAPANLAGVRTLFKALKKGQAIGLLPDQVPQNGEGIWVDFFGRPAYTMTLPAKLQQMSGAPLILSYAERLPFGRGYVIRFVPFEGNLGDTPEQQTLAINRAMEQLIARCPAQYIWSYNRYKTPPGVEAPPATAATTKVDA
ncbi:bacterial lipid A biosynthesis acyltransferase family protein [Collimonas arenae]|uniref:Bacterial lipid A biosynthesis acyltransferase family protein n=1 Tax=Collimonas arenae TaxID=279058 RepID=A0A127PVT0_9BURK|nr:lysophospholipid acyltransferase family protein [Collimonas arenae]AMP01897.1 bacterial lipid A biosynthesis acyltransferase family protein [Collimonas arenae]AMP11796.1 bacterial lipid A biosynthesis acyltransferase family protein [Collimonas arenae]